MLIYNLFKISSNKILTYNWNESGHIRSQ